MTTTPDLATTSLPCPDWCTQPRGHGFDGVLSGGSRELIQPPRDHPRHHRHDLRVVPAAPRDRDDELFEEWELFALGRWS